MLCNLLEVVVDVGRLGLEFTVLLSRPNSLQTVSKQCLLYHLQSAVRPTFWLLHPSDLISNVGVCLRVSITEYNILRPKDSILGPKKCKASTTTLLWTWELLVTASFWAPNLYFTTVPF